MDQSLQLPLSAASNKLRDSRRRTLGALVPDDLAGLLDRGHGAHRQRPHLPHTWVL